MAKVIIFGIAENSSLAHFYLRHDSPHDVAGFCVHAEYMPESTSFEGVPVLAFEEVTDVFPSDEVSFFAPLAPGRMNKFRAEVYQAAKRAGYEFISYVSSKATVFPDAQIGENCFILEDNTIQPYVSIGNNVVLWSGNHIGHHGTIRDHVYVTSHVVISGRCLVDSFSFLGVNSTVRDGVHLGEGTFVAMAASITRDTQPWGVYRGNPATKAKVSSDEYMK